MNGVSRRAALALAIGACLAHAGRAATPGRSGPDAGFGRAIARAVDASAPGQVPTFVASYACGPGEAALPGPLEGAAFAYDNALAAIALVSEGDLRRAARIADAFVAACAHDRRFADGRIRNAYRAGPVGEGPLKLPGWWDAGEKRWLEDAYQGGTSTGNVAWVALALLNMHAATHRAAYRDAASGLLGWIAAHASAGPGPAGFCGGVAGFDDAQRALTWKSTEHNIDIAAAASWSRRETGDPVQGAMAERARAFVASRFVEAPGFFLLGTKPDGADADPAQLALDVQLWPVLGVAEAPAAWRRAVGFADKHLRRGDGMTFAGLGPNRWTEGTAQAALAFRAVGADALADACIEGLPRHAAPSGLLYATSDGDVPTGLLVEAEGGEALKYVHRPHLGATAWAVLAANRFNPFTGTRIG